MFQLEEEDDQQATFYRHVGFKFIFYFFLHAMRMAHRHAADPGSIPRTGVIPRTRCAPHALYR